MPCWAGRCRHCGKRISWRYPLVELVTGLLFFYFVFTLGPTPAAIKMCIFTAMLVALMFCDLEKRILPDELTVGGAFVGFVLALFVPVPDITASAPALGFSGSSCTAPCNPWLNRYAERCCRRWSYGEAAGFISRCAPPRRAGFRRREADRHGRQFSGTGAGRC